MDKPNKPGKAAPAKRGRGRPKAAQTFTAQLNVRVDADVRAAIEKYRDRYKDQAELREISDAVRHMLKRVLREEGLLK